MSGSPIIRTFSKTGTLSSMNNEQIILNERLRLCDEGLIGSTGSFIDYLLPSGKWISIPEPEQIHTAKAWSNMNYKVKDGEKPITQIKIWKPYSTKNGRGVAFKTADFYSQSQVKEIEV